ncbi:MAG TPA: hypothetical protein VEJ67_05980 [Candidatus Cybelea sp.]|nr:hypothetical protein [Candidatus Cybelea sp.]
MRLLLFAILLLTASNCVPAQSNSTPSAQASSPSSAAALPQDRHGGLSIAVDSYTDSERAKGKFGKSANPIPAGILPVEVFLKNETPHPIKVDLETVQLDVHFDSGDHQNLDWLSINRVATLIVHPGGTPSAPSERRFPIGLSTNKDKKVDNIAGQLRPFALDSGLVPPLGTTHGFLFFNMSHDFAAASKASLYVPDVSLLPDKAPLMFFEVPLASPPSSSPQASQD